MKRFCLVLAAALATLGADLGSEQIWSQLIKSGKSSMEAHHYSDAEKSFREAIGIARKIGANDARVSTSLLFAARAVNAQSRKEEAEDLARSSVVAMNRSLQHVHPKTIEQEFYIQDTSARLFDGAADIFTANNRYSEAEALYKRVIEVRERAVTESKPKSNQEFIRTLSRWTTLSHASAAEAQEKLANFYFRQKRFDDAAPLFARAAQARDSDNLGSKLYVAGDLGNEAVCLAANGKNADAEPLFQRALAIFEEVHAQNQPAAASVMQDYALLLKSTGRDEDAKAMAQKANAVLDKSPSGQTSDH